jgi:hypothetical protein
MRGIFTILPPGPRRDLGIGRFPARLDAVEVLEGPYGWLVRWWFAVEVPGETVRLPLETGTAITVGSRLAQLLLALGQPLPADERAAAAIDLTTLVGAPCQVQLDRRYEDEQSRQVVSAISVVLPPGDLPDQ